VKKSAKGRGYTKGLLPTSFLVMIISVIGLATVIAHPVRLEAQNPRVYLNAWADMLPDFVRGFEADAPLVISEGFKTQRYYSVSRIFYKANGSQHIEVSINDYSVNPDIYDQQLKQLRNAYASGEAQNSTGRFHGYLMQTNTEKDKIERAVYLGENLVVKVVHEGTIQDSSLSKTLMDRIALKRIKDVKDEALR
jgi:hypothetical protein